jgi:hypothetical protein
VAKARTAASEMLLNKFDQVLQDFHTFLDVIKTRLEQIDRVAAKSQKYTTLQS